LAVAQFTGHRCKGVAGACTGRACAEGLLLLLLLLLAQQAARLLGLHELQATGVEATWWLT
jgi:hypothetical protein